MYQQTFVQISHDISVEVKPLYLEKESNAVAHKHVFAYFISIKNMGDKAVQLLKRHWFIEDSATGNYEVDGEGVIGKKPNIEPGKSHKYNSFCVLKSYRGSMKGYYLMERENGDSIKVKIPKFLLSSHLLN
ncbi:MAG: Co2+/Mg2+ efflux protein ApaG [Balneolaceae bacterium]|nr:Co2+/Mg2+ efflux protein ApaG [Balneolaceae bacterium]